MRNLLKAIFRKWSAGRKEKDQKPVIEANTPSENAITLNNLESYSEVDEKEYSFLYSANCKSKNQIIGPWLGTESERETYFDDVLGKGLIKIISTNDEKLKLKKVDELKCVLRDNGLKVSGKKMILIERIISELEQEQYDHLLCKEEFYKRTPAGEKRYTELGDKRYEAHRKEYEERDAEFKEWHQKKVQEYLNDFKSKGFTKYTIVKSKRCDSPICKQMNGQTILIRDSKKGQNIPPFHENCLCSIIPDRSEYIESELRDYMEMGFTQYEVQEGHKCNCVICNKMAGKILEIKNAHMGVNLPPYHEECTCDILPYQTEEERDRSEEENLKLLKMLLENKLNE